MIRPSKADGDEKHSKLPGFGATTYISSRGTLLGLVPAI